MVKKASLGSKTYEAVLAFDAIGIVIGNSEIRALKKFFGDLPDWAGNPVTALELFCYNLEGDPLPITDEMHAKGQEWFIKSKRTVLKQITGGTSEYSQCKALVESATNGEIEEFKFVGMCDISSNFCRTHMPRRMTTIPIWKVILKNGGTFTYAYGSWQAGAGVVINPPAFV